MRQLLFIIALSFNFSLASAKEFPDLRKSFKNAKLISVTEIDPFNKIMSFGSNDSFEQLKAQLIKTLGEGWIESPEQKAEKSKIKDDDLKTPPPKNFNLAGNIVFISRVYPDTKIRLTVFKDKAFKTEHSILLAIERKKRQKKSP